MLIELHNVLVRKLGLPRQLAQEVIESNGYHVQPADAATLRGVRIVNPFAG